MTRDAQGQSIRFNKAAKLHAAGKLDKADRLYTLHLRAHPYDADALAALGVLRAQRGNVDKAVALLKRSAELAPAAAPTHFNLGKALFLAKRYKEAAASFRRALELVPSRAGIHNELGTCLMSMRRYAEAEAAFAAALKLDPALSEARDNSACTALLLHVDPAQQLAALKRIAALAAAPVTPMPRRGPQRESDKLRLAYVSGDFRAHPTSYLIAELIERHDRSRFEVIAISLGPDDNSATRRRMVVAFDRFVDASSLSTADIAKAIRRLGCDILVDLSGYIEYSRMAVFAHRPAPIQVSYLGWPATSGATFIDYIIADRFVIPDDHVDFYTEKVVRLPNCYQPNDRQRRAADDVLPRADCGLPDQGFVFCCFNNTAKITADVFAAWLRLLKAVPSSALWLLHDDEETSSSLRGEAAAQGVNPDRLVFAPRVSPPQHLARHAHADLVLDTLPYNAHTTASDALWQGVPVITCTGSIFAGRVATSLLHNVGLPELVTSSLTDYEALAVDLATNPRTLAAVKAKLAANRLSVPLFDTDGLRRHIEAAYLGMWDRFARELPPQGFDILAQDGSAR